MELMIILDEEYSKKEMRKLAIAFAKALAGDTK
jgi:hypothetical protein